MEKREYRCSPKFNKITLCFGLSFLILFPMYGAFKLGISNIPISFVLFMSALLGFFFINGYFRFKKKPVLTLEDSKITIANPFEKQKIIPIDSIVSINKGFNGGIILKLQGLFKSARINTKALLPEHKAEILEFLNAKIKNPNKRLKIDARKTRAS